MPGWRSGYSSAFPLPRPILAGGSQKVDDVGRESVGLIDVREMSAPLVLEERRGPKSVRELAQSFRPGSPVASAREYQHGRGECRVPGEAVIQQTISEERATRFAGIAVAMRRLDRLYAAPD